jgi:hypothetical protein
MSRVSACDHASVPVTCDFRTLHLKFACGVGVGCLVSVVRAGVSATWLTGLQVPGPPSRLLGGLGKPRLIPEAYAYQSARG